MELQHLRVFLVLAEELHFGRTARRLRVAQSAVSETIQSLERDVGAQLFVRARGITLTPAGTEFLASARRAIEELDRGATAARRVASGEAGRLSVSFGPLVALTGLAGTIARFQRDLPSIELDVQTLPVLEQLEALHQGKTDVAFVPAAKHDLGTLQHHVVARAPIAAILPSGHRLARRTSVTFGELSGERLLVLDDTKDARALARVLEQCRIHAFEPEHVVGLPHLETLLAFVAAQHGISFAPAVVGHARFPGVATIPVEPRITSEVIAVWDADRLASTGRRLIDFVSGNRREARP